MFTSLKNLQGLVEEESQPASAAYAYWQAELEEEKADLELAQTALDKYQGLFPGELTAEEESAYQAYMVKFGAVTDQPYIFNRYVVQPLLQQCSYLAQAEDNYQAIPLKLDARLAHPLYQQDTYARRSLELQKQLYLQSSQQSLKLSLAPEKIFDVLQGSFLLDGLLCLFLFATSRMIAATSQGLRDSSRAKHLLYFWLSLEAIGLAWGLSLLFLTNVIPQGDLLRSLQAVQRLPLRHLFGSEGWRVFLQYRGLVLVFLAGWAICQSKRRRPA